MLSKKSPLGRRSARCSVAVLTMLLLGNGTMANAAQSISLEEAERLNTEALSLYRAGRYDEAIPLAERALGIWEKALGPEHPDVARSLHNLVALFAAKSDITKAIAYQARAEKVNERNIALNLATGSERQKLLYLATLSGASNTTMTLHVESAPDNPVARRLAFTTMLRRKSRALDAMMESIATVRRGFNPQDQALFDQLTMTRARLATLVLGRPSTTDTVQHRGTIQSLAQQIEQFEADLSRRSAVFRVASQPVTIEAVQAALPPEAALVEFVRFNAIDFQKNQWLSPRYVAYVLHHQGEPAWIKLGEAADIEAAVYTLRKALRDPHRQDVKKLARTLDAQLMQPVRLLLGEKRMVLLSPDSLLHLVPFAALVDEQDRYLVEEYQFIYLTTGRDLLRLQVKTQPAQGHLLVANPDFGTTSVTKGNKDVSSKQGPTVLTAVAREAVDFSQIFFSSLPGTAEEARVLKTILPNATVLTQASATKRAIKHSTAPSILHIATHGFFLEDVVISPAPMAGQRLSLSGVRPEDGIAPGVRVGNPLLRSGLALAGANLRRSGEDDGILTAPEASGLNLWEPGSWCCPPAIRASAKSRMAKACTGCGVRWYWRAPRRR